MGHPEMQLPGRELLAVDRLIAAAPGGGIAGRRQTETETERDRWVVTII